MASSGLWPWELLGRRNKTRYFFTRYLLYYWNYFNPHNALLLYDSMFLFIILTLDSDNQLVHGAIELDSLGRSLWAQTLLWAFPPGELQAGWARGLLSFHGFQCKSKFLENFGSNYLLKQRNTVKRTMLWNCLMNYLKIQLLIPNKSEFYFFKGNQDFLFN